MRLLVDEIIDDENYYENLDFIKKRRFDLKFDYVFERLILLDDELVLEEDASDEIFILLKMEAELFHDFISFKGYSEGLTQKIKDCFPETEAIYLEAKLNEISDDNSN